MLFGDYHTHTKFSHGKNTVAENVEQAAILGLKEIAISDHGLGHMAMGIKRRDIPKMREEIYLATTKYGVKTYLGVEANLISENGDIDIKNGDEGLFDILICGYHKAVWGKTNKDFWRFVANNNLSYWFTKSKGIGKIHRNTKAYIEAIKKNPIDIISHINRDMLVDAVEIAKCARDYGTHMEINSKQEHVSDEILFEMAQTGVKFILSSDAHDKSRVGDIELALAQAKRVGIEEKQIANLNGLPIFRHKITRGGKKI